MTCGCAPLNGTSISTTQKPREHHGRKRKEPEDGEKCSKTLLDRTAAALMNPQLLWLLTHHLHINPTRSLNFGFSRLPEAAAKA